MAPVLPFEIWWAIVEYISTDDLFNLRTLNRALYTRATIERFRIVIFNYPNTPRFIEVLNRLMNTPYLVGHVQTLKIWPEDLYDCLAPSTQPKQKTQPILSFELPSSEDPGFPFKVLPAVICQEAPVKKRTSSDAIRGVLKSWNMSNPLKHHSRIDARLSLFHKVVTQMDCLREYHIHWINPSRASADTVSLCTGLLASLWSSINPNLRVLTLNTTLSILSAILPPSTHFQNLQELSITFTEVFITPPLSSSDPTAPQVPEKDHFRSPENQMTTIASFVAGLAQTLTSLSITSTGSPNIFLLLKSLTCRFPLLTRLSLSFSPSFSIPQDARAIAKFLSRHSTQLRSLTFRGRQKSFYPERPPASTTNIKNTEFLRECLRSVSFYGCPLTTLVLDFLFPQEICNVGIALFGNICDSVTVLSIDTFTLNSNDVRHLLSVLAHCPLRSLTFEAFVLLPNYICLVAQSRSDLEQLTISVYNATVSMRRTDEEQFVEEWEHHLAENDFLLGGLSGWRLRDLSILDSGMSPCWLAMHTVAGYVPSILRLAGQKKEKAPCVAASLAGLRIEGRVVNERS